MSGLHLLFFGVIIQAMSDKKKSQPQDDVFFEEENGSVAFELKKMRDKLKECQRQKDEYLVGWQRAKADFINARKDWERQLDDFKKYAEYPLVEDLLPVVDGFENAFKDEGWQKVDKTWQNGIKYLHNQFISVLKEHGLEPIEAVGKEFDPREHEAVAELEVKKEEDDGIVMEEYRKGYKLKEKVIRPSQVKVGKYTK